MEIVYLSLGSNIGNRSHYLMTALEKLINSGCRPLDISQIYESPPWGFGSDKWFFNMAVKMETTHSVHQILELIAIVESELGRERLPAEGYQDRTIDIDILFYGNFVLNSTKLTVPHPKIAKRRFVLVPLNEIAPLLIHPVLQKTITELLKECNDNGPVVALSDKN